MERRVLSRASRPPALRRGRVALRTLILALVGAALSIGAAVAPFAGVRGEAVAGIGLLTGIFASLAGWFVHTVPGHSRWLKYGLVLVGAGLLSLGMWDDEAGRGALGIPYVLGAVAIWQVGSLAVATVFALFVIQPDQPLEGRSARITLATHRHLTAIQGIDAGSVLLLFALSLVNLVLPYLVVRFAVKAKLAERPVLYLRSFGQIAAPRVFSEVVGPALTRRATFVGLVHTNQTQSSLQSGVPLLWTANFAAVGDAHWQDWVLAAMDRSRGVILDVSGDTPGLRWEIEQAAARVPPSRILVLGDARRSVPVIDGAADVVYDLDGDLDAARAEVAAFGARINEADFGYVDPRPRSFTTRRRLFGGFDLAFALSAFFFALSVPPALFLYRMGGTAELDARKLELTAQRAYVLEERIGLERIRLRGGECEAIVERLFDEEGEVDDAWGTPLRVDCTEGVTIRTAGPDRTWDTDDDRAFD